MGAPNLDRALGCVAGLSAFAVPAPVKAALAATLISPQDGEVDDGTDERREHPDEDVAGAEKPSGPKGDREPRKGERAEGYPESTSDLGHEKSTSNYGTRGVFTAAFVTLWCGLTLDIVSVCPESKGTADRSTAGSAHASCRFGRRIGPGPRSSADRAAVF